MTDDPRKVRDFRLYPNNQNPNKDQNNNNSENPFKGRGRRPINTDLNSSNINGAKRTKQINNNQTHPNVSILNRNNPVNNLSNLNQKRFHITVPKPQATQGLNGKPKQKKTSNLKETDASNLNHHINGKTVNNPINNHLNGYPQHTPNPMKKFHTLNNIMNDPMNEIQTIILNLINNARKRSNGRPLAFARSCTKQLDECCNKMISGEIPTKIISRENLLQISSKIPRCQKASHVVTVLPQNLENDVLAIAQVAFDKWMASATMRTSVLGPYHVVGILSIPNNNNQIIVSALFAELSNK
ncbi:hypothetical protein TRFO_40737 [Tritrichomonas foetus]|uniref:Uncharacterized protein n=1 Tax=Tritrichomonas foetus TaxID=1144522 RepID=A0A1J4IZU7_9EUKA|nr:hypothetical protein TRFO_40737 [Tritrichomonas foetus]|eukprot:OHS92926.1 hypothetical protein TRFO_40737 [Tritrichomonas foetus]